jgi:hypothetical protein
VLFILGTAVTEHGICAFLWLQAVKSRSLYTVWVSTPSCGSLLKPGLFHKKDRVSNLIVLSVGLSLGIQNSGPVVGFEVGLGVNINLDFDKILALSNGVSRNSNRREGSTNKLSNSRWAPLSNNISGLEGELGSKDRVLDGAVRSDLTERQRLVYWGALITKSVNGSFGVDGDADGKSSGDTRSGGTWIGKILDGDARNVLNLGGEFSHAQLSARSGRLLWPHEGGSTSKKGGEDGELHL